jgi:hypothetical protein
MAWFRRIRWLCFAVPVVVLAAAYAGIAAATGTAWPWLRIVHEDGQRTLFETVFYFEHALRELPLDLLLAWAAAGAAAYFFPQSHSTPAAHRKSLWYFTAVAVLIVAGMVVGTWWTGGTAALLGNLAQMQTRPGAAPEWGAHWRYHLLERLALLLAAFTLFGTMAAGARIPSRGKPKFFLGSLAAFLLLTIFFRLTAAPFTDPVYLGHQTRELLTHGLVTLPLAAAACLALARPPADANGDDKQMSLRWLLWPGGTAILTGSYVLVGAMASRASGMGQTPEFHRLVLAHFFEHSFGYALVPVFAGSLYLLHTQPAAPDTEPHQERRPISNTGKYKAKSKLFS